jgi:hypothetical protein
MAGKFLEGEQLPFRTAADRRKLVGKFIRYLRRGDIDRSGRGYFFPRSGWVEYAKGRFLMMDNTDVQVSELVEVVDGGTDKGEPT